MKRMLLALTVLCTAVLSMTACMVTNLDNAPKTPAAVATSTPGADITPDATAQPANANEPQFIGEERAEQIALEKAGISVADVKYININLDFDDGIWKYEVEFKKDRTEYEVDVNAIDGNILKWEEDR